MGHPDKSVVATVSKQFAKAFGARFTRQSLGKVVPAAGILLGGAFNWATLEAIVDAADIAYRRFLLEKYPHLADEQVPGSFPDVGPDGPDDADEAISVLDEITKAGGPNLHSTRAVHFREPGGEPSSADAGRLRGY